MLHAATLGALARENLLSHYKPWPCFIFKPRLELKFSIVLCLLIVFNYSHALFTVWLGWGGAINSNDKFHAKSK